MVALTTRDYALTLRRFAKASLSGGIVHDALAARAAEKAKVDQVLTLNERDFARLENVFRIRVTTPS